MRASQSRTTTKSNNRYCLLFASNIIIDKDDLLVSIVIYFGDYNVYICIFMQKILLLELDIARIVLC